MDNQPVEAKHNHGFNEQQTLHTLRHFLPAQAPLKDFVHHNTLHAFQDLPFHEACARSSKIFGYKSTLNIEEFRDLYNQNRIRKDVLESVINRKKGAENLDKWTFSAIQKDYEYSIEKRTGKLRSIWKNHYHFDMNSRVHPKVFRILNNYLDQGIATWNFPLANLGLWDAIKQLESTSYVSFFRTEKASSYIKNNERNISDLLNQIVGDEDYYEQYIFDQQFGHPGWSGMINFLETNPDALLDQRKAKLQDLIALELLFEIDALEHHFKKEWKPIAQSVPLKPFDIFGETPLTELDEVLQIWQEAFEWTYYDDVLAGLGREKSSKSPEHKASFQGFFCIDDREISLRQHIETLDPNCETFGTPGHFALDTYYQPENGKFHTKICPAPLTPIHLIKETGRKEKNSKDAHFSGQSHNLFAGFLITQTLGFWSAMKLAWNIFRPSISPATASSFKHMDQFSELKIECTDPSHKQDGLQVGFTLDEMVIRVENVLKSTGLVKDFAPIIYIVGHGSSSVNNTHYAGYDCGACSGRPGSVNARAFSTMANDPRIRAILKDRGIIIPEESQFLGGMHDTSRDEIVFYDTQHLTSENKARHLENEIVFKKALSNNAKERARRFELINYNDKAEIVHKKVKLRTVSLFEPRPELNHATNSLCIVGRRDLTKYLFLDRRAFLNSYDYQIDPDGKYLEGILNAAAPVCGGINLEYYFSRVDNQRLGAGTKLPHNVMGLIGVANGIEGDLRTGLPSQMIEVHDPIRLMLIVEQLPEVVLKTVKRNPATYEWIKNEWVKFAVVHPVTHKIYIYENDEFLPYNPLTSKLEKVVDFEHLLETSRENLPVYFLN